MDAKTKQIFIRRKAQDNDRDVIGRHILWSRHAITEAVNDSLSRINIESALKQAEVIEDYPSHHRKLPDCLVLGDLSDTRPVHAGVAIDIVEDRIFSGDGLLTFGGKIV